MSIIEDTPHKAKLWLGIASYALMSIYYGTKVISDFWDFLAEWWVVLGLFVLGSVPMYYYIKEEVWRWRTEMLKPIEERLDAIDRTLHDTVDGRLAQIERDHSEFVRRVEGFASLDTKLDKQIQGHVQTLNLHAVEEIRKAVNHFASKQGVPPFFPDKKGQSP